MKIIAVAALFMAMSGVVSDQVRGRNAGIIPVNGGDPARGARAIGTYGCGSCHVIPGIAGASNYVGPPLNAYAKRAYVAGKLPNEADNLIYWIQQPQAVWPGNAMPNLGVTDQDAHDIAAYLYTLR